jgi:hypothetical protein
MRGVCGDRAGALGHLCLTPLPRCRQPLGKVFNSEELIFSPFIQDVNLLNLNGGHIRGDL